MKTLLMLLTLALLFIASPMTAVNFAVQPQIETQLSLERTEAISTGVSATMQGYELRCRGGGLRFNSTPGRNLPTGEQMMNMTVDFVVGTQAAGGRDLNLKPGQCSWVDRGFRPGEPAQIRLEIVYFGQQKQTLHGSPVDRSPTAAETYPDAQNVPQYLSNQNRYWSFWVYNTNNGYLQATGNRYLKPAAIKINPNDKPKLFPR
jgi:hypothetical protein